MNGLRHAHSIEDLRQLARRRLPRGVFDFFDGDAEDESGRLGGAGLDVYCNDRYLDPRFLRLPRTTLQPHIGSATVEARTAMGMVALHSLARWLDARQPSDNCLNPSTLDTRTRL